MPGVELDADGQAVHCTTPGLLFFRGGGGDIDNLLVLDGVMLNY